MFSGAHLPLLWHAATPVRKPYCVLEGCGSDDLTVSMLLDDMQQALCKLGFIHAGPRP
jgi:hypothetical protein